MAKNGKKWLVDNLRDGFKYATSKRAIPVLKGKSLWPLFRSNLESIVLPFVSVVI